MRKLWRVIAAGLAVSLCAVVPAVSTAGRAAAASPGGSATVVMVGTEWPNMDPALDNQAAADIDLMNAVYGQLFTQNPSAGCPGGCKNPGALVPDLAKGWKVSPDGRTVTIELRPGMTFQDGTPFNAAAVAYNITRDLSPQSICLCKTNFADVTGVTTNGPDAVEIHLSQRYVPLIASFIAAGPNWIISPTALQKMGETVFGQHPVGAGPFEVTKDVASSELDLTRFSNYWEKGHPALNSLKFEAVSSDEAALSALKAGTAQVVIGVNTPQIIGQAKQNYQVPVVPAIDIQTVEFNTKAPPFNNLKAREAIAYATDPKPIINKLLTGVAVPVQDQVGPGSSYYEKTVPGYHAYNLAKAKALVKQLGGLSFNFITLSNPFNQQVAEALQSEWQRAGIKMKIQAMLLTGEVSHFETGTWQALPGAAGGPDPDAGVQSLASRFATNGTFTCCKDPKLDALINKSTTTTAKAARQKVFDQIFQYIDKNVLAVDVYAESYAVLAQKGLTGLRANVGGAAEGVAVHWETLGTQP